MVTFEYKFSVTVEPTADMLGAAKADAIRDGTSVRQALRAATLGALRRTTPMRAYIIR